MGNSCFSKKHQQLIASKLSIASSKSAVPEESLPQPFNTGITIKWKLGDQIAEGKYCKIYQCINLRSGELLILKSYPISQSSSGFIYELRKLRKEVEVLKCLDHKSLIQIFQMESSYESVNILIEYIPGGCLQELILKYGPLEENIIISYLKQIIQTIKYLHEQGISHNNILAENIYVNSEGKIKLSGFKNYTKLIKNDLEKNLMAERIMNFHTSLSPEAINGHIHDRSDVWSIGCLAIHLLTGKDPFDYISKDKDIVIKQLSLGGLDVVLPKATENMKVFLEACLNRDPEKRPGFVELLNFEAVSGKKVISDFNLDDSMRISLNRTTDRHAIVELDNE